MPTLQEQMDFVIGPQAATGSWYDFTLLAKAKLHGEACPVEAPQKPLDPAEPRPESFIGPTEYDAAMAAWALTPAIKAWLNALNSFELLNYYDLPLSEYIAHARTGDSTFLTFGDKGADAWWKHPTWIGEGRKRPWIGEMVTYTNGVKKWRDENAAPPPRHAGIGGLVLRAMRGRFEMWDWINAYTRFFFDLYVKRRVVNNQPLYDLREGAFSFRFAVLLSQVLPDSFPLQAGGAVTNGAELRAQYLADVEAAVIHYFGRTQSTDGSWRWNDNWRDSDGGSLQGVMQPFMVGLLLRALCDAHQVVGPIAKASAEKQILSGCRHLYSGGPYIKDQIEQTSGKAVRGFHYFYHGGTSVNPTRYAKGDIAFPWTAAESWYVPSTRQAISTILGAFGYAYKISGDPFFKMAGDEMFDSAYGGGDGFRAMMNDTAKNFNQNVWASSYQAWAGATSAPVPNPTPSPTPTPTQPTSPSPDGTKAITITDKQGGVWTFEAGSKRTLRNDTWVGGGQGTFYKYVNSIVYVLGLDSSWYQWSGSRWIFVGPEPGVIVVEPPIPIPDPVPTPTPVLPRVLLWPPGKAEQNLLWQNQAKEGYRANKHVDRPVNMPKGNYVEFVKF